MVKLAGLFIKTLSKPLSKRIKHEFSRYEFTQGILVSIGQTSHSITSTMTIWSAGYRVRSINPLERDKALSDGSEIVGESFILAVSVGWMLWEYNRGNEKTRVKEEKQRAVAKHEREALQAKLHTLDVRVKALEVVVKTNSQSLLSIGPRYVEPPSAEIVPIEDEHSDASVSTVERERVVEESSHAVTASQTTKTWLRWPW